MFKPMRRKEEELDQEQTQELLRQCAYGVLSTLGEDGYCYGVPLNYIYYKNAIYFHCADEGHKIDNMTYHHQVSFCVVGMVEVVGPKFTTKFESAVVFGGVEEVYGREKESSLIALLEKYAPDCLEAGIKYLDEMRESTKVFKIIVERISGKSKFQK